MSTSNKLICTLNANSDTLTAYLDTAAELSKIDRKNHHQVTEKGVPLVYDLMVTVSTPSKVAAASVTDQVTMTGTALTCGTNWQVRNAIRMTHFAREDLRRESGVTKGAIGKYAKTLRLNMDEDMFNIAYRPQRDVDPSFQSQIQRAYAQFDGVGSLTSYAQSVVPTQWTGGVWDYTQLAQVLDTDANTADPFFINVLGNHSADAPGPYAFISAVQGYNQRRQTVLDDSTVTAGGDTQFVNNESPFFRVPQQDSSEDAYVDITLDEQDNPPYDRTVGNPPLYLADSNRAQPVEYFQTTMSNSQVSFRIQAPLGLLQLDLEDLYGSGFNPLPSPPSTWATVQPIILEVECLGTYEM
ncbi:MAG: hypothetical protein [Circular genetic element sp.]|nr:MAG: hypothetical protein [Circular genetic element sp.]